MSWKNILKKEEDRLGLEIKLEQLVHDWGMDKDMSDYEYMADRNGPNIEGLEINVFFEDNYEGEEDLSQEEILEQDAGHYRIDFASEKYEEFAMGDYTYNDGFNIHEFNPEKLDIDELKAAINGLR